MFSVLGMGEYWPDMVSLPSYTAIPVDHETTQLLCYVRCLHACLDQVMLLPMPKLLVFWQDPMHFVATAVEVLNGSSHPVLHS